MIQQMLGVLYFALVISRLVTLQTRRAGEERDSRRTDASAADGSPAPARGSSAARQRTAATSVVVRHLAQRCQPGASTTKPSTRPSRSAAGSSLDTGQRYVSPFNR